jgi:hypothetical protein
MKNSLKSLKLWQKKRNELQINDDPQQDWLQMQSLLDQHMPATNHSAVKKPSGFKGLKLLSKLFIAFSAAAMVYTASYVFFLKSHNHQIKHKTHKGTLISGDSIINDSSSIKKNSIAYKDSLLLQKQTATTQNNILIKHDLDKATPKPLSSDSIKNNNAVSLANKSNSSLLSTQNKISAQNKIKTAFINQSANRVSTGSLALNKISNGASSLQTNRSSLVKIKPGTNHSHKSYDKSKTRTQKEITGANEQSSIGTAGGNKEDHSALEITRPLPDFDLFANSMQYLTARSLNYKIVQKSIAAQSTIVKNNKDKNAKAKNTNPSNSKIDWGILMGVNSSGSFTPAKQNANFYGSAPVDAFFGLFASYKLNDKWAISSQIKLFSPQTITTTYSHANQSKVDSTQSLTITASRKQYAISVPIYLQYKATNSINLKAGPVINFPVKQINSNSTLQPTAIRSDSVYYPKITGILNATK